VRTGVAGLALALTACGRLDFDAIAHDATADAQGLLDAPPAPLGWVATFVQHQAGTGTSDKFNAHAVAAGDAIVLEVGCSANTQPTGVTVTAPGWTFTQLSSLVGTTAIQRYAASFGAIAPNTSPIDVTVTWNVSNCDIGRTELGDELAFNDPTGGTTTFDGHVEATGMGDCTATLLTSHADDALWVACVSSASLTAPLPEFVKSDDDGAGDWAGYRLARDPAGTAEPVGFTNGTNSFALVAVSIKPM